jgi:hypothetical protein
MTQRRGADEGNYIAIFKGIITGQRDPPRSGETLRSGEAGTGDCHAVASLSREYLELARPVVGERGPG